MPVSKTDAQRGTLKGRYKALRRYFRDRKAQRIAAEDERLAEIAHRLNEFAQIDEDFLNAGF